MPADLQQFIEGGDPPVYMTFGSMLAGEEDPGQVLGILSDAARLAQCRAIIQADWSGLSGHPQADHVYRINQAPHQHIFSYCAAVVHHGGAGTTQAATLAGCPSIVVEHASDQPLWGAVLQRMGIAPKMLHRRSLNTRRLACAIQAVMETPVMKEKAGEIGTMMQNEDGLATAVALIEQHGRIDNQH
jgi:UDP:flavonoid glycosyltransferase YjiC (YdhE family)